MFCFFSSFCGGRRANPTDSGTCQITQLHFGMRLCITLDVECSVGNDVSVPAFRCPLLAHLRINCDYSATGVARDSPRWNCFFFDLVQNQEMLAAAYVEGADSMGHALSWSARCSPSVAKREFRQVSQFQPSKQYPDILLWLASLRILQALPGCHCWLFNPIFLTCCL